MGEQGGKGGGLNRTPTEQHIPYTDISPGLVPSIKKISQPGGLDEERCLHLHNEAAPQKNKKENKDN